MLIFQPIHKELKMQNNPTAAIIIIGNEILSGRTLDLNTNFIAKELGKMGVELAEVRVIADVESKIIETVREMKAKFDHIFTTGGIGPTHDDITSESIAKAFNLPYVLNEEVRQILIKRYGAENVSEARLKMAKMPQNAELIFNSATEVPSFSVENVFVLAGVPHIMQAMFSWLQANGKIKSGPSYVSEKIDFPKPESLVAKILENVQNAHPELSIGSYPYHHENVWGTEICIRGTNSSEVACAKGEIEKQIKELVK